MTLAIEQAIEQLPTKIETAKAHPLHSLVSMHSYCRPAYSATDNEFIEKWIDPLGCDKDTVGNRYLRIGHAPILWSCHTDTVHRLPGGQRVRIDGQQFLKLARKQKRYSDCLGADD